MAGLNIALHLGMSESQVRYARQLGLRHVVSGLPGSLEGVLELEDLRRARAFFDARGLFFDVIENLPTTHYDKAMFGLPGRDEQIDKVRESIRNMGTAGIRVLQFQWMLLGGLRTEYSPTGRGGSRVARFDMEVAGRMPLACQVWRSPGNTTIHAPDKELSSEDVWSYLIYFLKGLAPVAEEAGVRLAIHPDDPPIPTFMGVARIMTSLEAFQRLIDTVSSPSVGLGFCQGTISAIPGVDIPQAIRRFGGQGKIFFAHFRNSIGALPRFDEVFPDEGDTDLFECARAYREVGFDGLIRIDHTPGVAGDRNDNRGFAHQVGYAKALDDAIDQIDAGTVRQRVVRGWKAAPPRPRLQLALTADCFDDIQLMMAQQMGVDQIVAEPKAWNHEMLSAMRNRVEKAGLNLAGIETLPPGMYNKAILGAPGSDEQIETVCEAIRQAGAAGIGLLGYAWTQPGPGRTSTRQGRGGALVPVYDHGEAEAMSASDPPPTEERLWENLEVFLGRALPVAEAAGVRLACKPDDPPVPSLRGVPRILCSVEATVRLLDLSPSPSHGIDFYAGPIAMMPGANVTELIGRFSAKRFGAQSRIFMARLNPRSGSGRRFEETFLDEDASVFSVLLAFKSIGFSGPIRVAPPPRMEGDADWGHTGHAFHLGYLRAMMQVAERME